MRPGRLYPIAVGGGFGLCPGAVAADRYGNVLIGDQARNRVMVAPVRPGTFYGQRMATGRVHAVAGDEVLDTVESVVRLVAVRSGTFYGQAITAGRVYVVAGHHRGSAGLGEGGPATQAWLENPQAIAVDPAGRLLIAEYEGQRIQAVTP